MQLKNITMQSYEPDIHAGSAWWNECDVLQVMECCGGVVPPLPFLSCWCNSHQWPPCWLHLAWAGLWEDRENQNIWRPNILRDSWGLAEHMPAEIHPEWEYDWKSIILSHKQGQPRALWALHSSGLHARICPWAGTPLKATHWNWGNADHTRYSASEVEIKNAETLES